MPPPDGYATKRREVAMISQDAEAFSIALLEIWPDIKFLNNKTGQEIIERDGKIVGRRPKKNLRYYSSLAEPEVFSFHVWREPEDWDPLWLGPNKYNVYELPNKPRFRFTYEASVIRPNRRTQLDSGRIWGLYHKEDKEHLSFLNKVWRLTAKLTTNVLDVHDRETGEVLQHSYRSMHWVGHHTAEWCRADPDRRIDESWRPGTELSNAE